MRVSPAAGRISGSIKRRTHEITADKHVRKFTTGEVNRQNGRSRSVTTKPGQIRQTHKHKAVVGYTMFSLRPILDTFPKYSNLQGMVVSPQHQIILAGSLPPKLVLHRVRLGVHYTIYIVRSRTAHRFRGIAHGTDSRVKLSRGRPRMIRTSTCSAFLTSPYFLRLN